MVESIGAQRRRARRALYSPVVLFKIIYLKNYHTWWSHFWFRLWATNWTLTRTKTNLWWTLLPFKNSLSWQVSTTKDERKEKVGEVKAKEKFNSFKQTRLITYVTTYLNNILVSRQCPRHTAWGQGQRYLRLHSVTGHHDSAGTKSFWRLLLWPDRRDGQGIFR